MIPSRSQDIFVYATCNETYWVNTKTKEYKNVTLNIDISEIVNLSFHEESGTFYVLANKLNDIIGFYVL